MENRYIRQEAFWGIGKDGQEKLKTARVAIVGLGALGTVTANHLTRAGVGYIRLIDRDYVELNNLQRQSLFDEADAEKAVPKAIAAYEHLLRINSQIALEPVITDVNSSNIDSLIGDVDLIVDATDNFEVRFLINEACHVWKKPWIYGAAVGAYGLTMNFLAKEDSPCLCCLIGEELSAPGTEPTCATAGVLNTLTNIIASLQSTEAIKILTGSDAVRKELVAVDLWNNTFDSMILKKDPECPVCCGEKYEFYGRYRGVQSTSLCGRDSVQVIPEQEADIDFAAFALKLNPLGKVSYTKYTLDFDDGNVQIKLFRNGRAIIKHVNDENRAKSIYSEYIGL